MRVSRQGIVRAGSDAIRFRRRWLPLVERRAVAVETGTLRRGLHGARLIASGIAQLGACIPRYAVEWKRAANTKDDLALPNVAGAAPVLRGDGRSCVASGTGASAMVVVAAVRRQGLSRRAWHLGTALSTRARSLPATTDHARRQRAFDAAPQRPPRLLPALLLSRALSAVRLSRR